MRILFISTHNLATNPRLVKEIDLALLQGFEVSLLCCEFDNWSKGLNEQIKRRLVPLIKYYPVQGNRNPFIPWAVSSILHFSAKKLLLLFSTNTLLLSLRSNKRSWLLLRQLKGIKEAINLVVAHNPGSFYPAMRFAQKNKIPFGIDLEDYHPGESNHTKTSLQVKQLQKKILPEAAYITAASPLILEYVQKDINRELKNTMVILNYFPRGEFLKPVTEHSEKLKLVWFSQQVSFGRGLEQIIPIINKFPGIELHLFGNTRQVFKDEYLKGGNIFIHDALPQKELHQRLSQFDIGLAIEPGKDLNNRLAISNKILAYFQSGLYILASDTEGQKQFMEQYDGHGILTSMNQDLLSLSIRKLLTEKENIRSAAQNRFEKAALFCWENESKKLVKVWEGKS